MAPKNVNTRLATARRLILQARGVEPPRQRDAGADKQPIPKTWRDILFDLTGIDLHSCPQCKKGRLIRRPLLRGDVMLCYGSAPVAA